MEFQKESHQYTQGGERYQSVSSLIRKYKKPFPKEFIAEKVANKQGRDIEGVLREWELKGELAIDFGNAIHKSIELYLEFGEKPKHSFLLQVVEEFIKLTKDKKLHSEVAVYSDELKTAGTIDLIEALGNKKVSILDIKTNGELDKDASDYFLAPFEYLRATKVNEYRLQLSAYARLMELRGYKVKDLQLYHYSDKFEVIDLEPIKNINDLWS